MIRNDNIWIKVKATAKNITDLRLDIMTQTSYIKPDIEQVLALTNEFITYSKIYIKHFMSSIIMDAFLIILKLQ